jgi:hypothetical protein
MFRALLCPSSGAPYNCLRSLWLPYDCRVGRVSSCFKRVQPGNHTVTRCCKGSWRGLLMMGTTVPETCWAVSTQQSNKYKIDLHLVGCFIEWMNWVCTWLCVLFEYLKMHGTTNHKSLFISLFHHLRYIVYKRLLPNTRNDLTFWHRSFTFKF